MTIGTCHTLGQFGQRVGAILSSYKLWILAAATLLVLRGVLPGFYWFLLAVLIISARAFESVVRAWPLKGGTEGAPQ